VTVPGIPDATLDQPPIRPRAARRPRGMTRVGSYALRRLAILPFAIILVATLAFALVNLLPGDPARVIAGDVSSQEQVTQIRAELGLDEPLLERYKTFVSDLAQGSLGTSYYTKTPVATEIRQRLPGTLELTILSVALASLIGISLGIVGAYFSGRLPDRGVRSFIVVAQSIPDFFLGLILIYVLFFLLGVAPAPVGQLGLLDEPPPHVTGSIMVDAALAGQWDTLGSALRHAMLPVITLGIFFSAFLAKITRSVLREAMASDHVEFARACGLSERTAVGYALKSVRVPIITYVGLLLAILSGGAAIVETVFAWNGIGQWAVQAILRLDVPSIQGFVVVVGLIALTVYLVTDLIVLAVDPRVKYTEGA
jgi:ABC-type dipeptide/oligopeptide/nickel transport system permease component